MSHKEKVSTLPSKSPFPTTVKKPRKIVYHTFSVEIVGPRYRTRLARRKIRKIFSRTFLREIEQTSKQAAEKELPWGFRIQIS